MKININRYPSIKNYLLGFGIDRLSQTGKILECGNKARKKTPHRWFELQDNCAYHEQFNKKKAVFPFISQHPRFSYDLGLYYVEVTGYIMTGNNLKYLILVLNSRPGFYLYKNIYTSLTLGKRGVGYQKHSLEKFPIPKPSKNDLMVSRRLFSQMASLQERKIINEQKNQKRPSWNTV